MARAPSTNGSGRAPVEKSMTVAKAMPVGKDPYTEGSGWGPVPIMTSGMTFRDVGSHGLRQYGGWVREEFLPQLVGRQAARTYREMLDNSSMVGATIFTITQVMRRVTWRVVPASDKPEAKKEAKFADSLRLDMSHTWGDFLVEALSMLGHGYAPHEIVYKRRNGRKPISNAAIQAGQAGVASSLYDDGRIGWRRLPLRGQDTILKWFFSKDGQIRGVTQQPWIGQLTDIPMEKMLLFRPSAHKNNPEGRSVLRNAYRPWYFTKRLEEQEAIMFERLGGLPVLYVPNELLEGAAAGDAKAMAAFEQYKKIVTNVRVDEQMGVILPSNTYMGANGPSAVRMYEFQLLTPNAGRTLSRTSDAIDRYKLETLMVTLADFLMLGHGAGGGRGSQNLSLSKEDLFYSATVGWLAEVADVLNRHGLRRIWDLNGLDYDLMPRYEPDLPQRADIDALGNFIQRIGLAGMPMFPNEELETYIRDAAGLPDVVDMDDEAHQKAAEPKAAPIGGGGFGMKPGATPDAATLQKVLLGSFAKQMKNLRNKGRR